MPPALQAPGFARSWPLPNLMPNSEFPESRCFDAHSNAPQTGDAPNCLDRSVKCWSCWPVRSEFRGSLVLPRAASRLSILQESRYVQHVDLIKGLSARWNFVMSDERRRSLSFDLPTRSSIQACMVETDPAHGVSLSGPKLPILATLSRLHSRAA